MGVSIERCFKCGDINYDDNMKEDKNEMKICANKCKTKIIYDYKNNSHIVYSKYLNIRWISRRHKPNEFFNKIEWLIENIDKQDTNEFLEVVQYINSFSY